MPLWTFRFSGGGEIGASGPRLEDMVAKARRVGTDALVIDNSGYAAALIAEVMGRGFAVEIWWSGRVRAERERWALGRGARMTGGHVRYGAVRDFTASVEGLHLQH